MSDQTSELVDQVMEAVSRKAPIRIVGNDSKRFMGRDTSGNIVTTASHSGIVEYDPTELVVSVRSGTTISELNCTLAGYGQYVGCEPPEFESATIGGSLACNQSGPARPWNGSIRDHVLGVRLINGRGEHLHFGGRVLKNVAGYDVSRLQAGAMGTLGLITEITLRVYPRPQYEATMCYAIDVSRAIDAMQMESSRTSLLSGACWVNDRVYLRFCGREQAVVTHLRRVDGERLPDETKFWSSLRDQQHSYFKGDKPIWRFSTMAAASQDCDGGPWLIDWGGAQRWHRGEYDFSVQESLAKSMRGQVMLYRGGNRYNEVFHSRSRTQQEIHLRIKQSFDPNGLLNPGRLYSWM